jgi:hypothetical protein
VPSIPSLRRGCSGFRPNVSAEVRIRMKPLALSSSTRTADSLVPIATKIVEKNRPRRSTCSTGLTEPASYAQCNYDIRNARFPDRLVVVSALGRAFDRDGIWHTRWPCCLRRLLRHRRDYGSSRSMSGAHIFRIQRFSRFLVLLAQAATCSYLFRYCL